MPEPEIKQTDRLAVIRILKKVKVEIQSIEKDGNPERVHECWEDVCEQLNSIESSEIIKEHHLLDSLIQLISVLHGEQAAG